MAEHSMAQPAYEYLCRLIRKKRIALGQAESRSGVTQEEINTINRQIELLEWTSQLVLAVKEE